MHTNRSKQQIAGILVSGFVAFALVGSAIAKMAHVPKMFDGLIRAGIPEAAILPIALLELSCLTLFLIARTTVLGAILLTGYFGGATLTHIIAAVAKRPPTCSRRAGGKYVTWQEEQRVPKCDRFGTMVGPKPSGFGRADSQRS